ncbi:MULTISPECIES: MFS transporter [unclassified Chelatococcus]|uniref:MFS transporter n=1 Tax=unclassified Chelatococcus TaxID=2638111 RepID=UPI001BCEF432|nr:MULTISPECIES: MFS transporter [unclassified Chelatococcus]MBS7700987.1 MFS transporter [Chelatococcus sp. YT9]MBX3555520.1 MFS transporter [Chelatococcus sp.]
MSLPQRTILVAAVYLGTFMATLAISIVTVALPAIQVALRTDLAGLQWVVGSYALSLSSFMLSAGSAGDRYGRKRIWLLGVGLFTLGSAVSAAAPSLAVLIAGCATQGVGGALLVPGGLSILTQAFSDPRERAHVIGGWSSFGAVSLVLGPMLGGLLVDNVGWPSIFLINIPIGILAISLGIRGIAESSDPTHAALDPWGQVLSILFLGALTYALISVGSSGWTAPATLTAFLVAAVALPAFLIIEMRVTRPVLPLDLFRDPSFANINFISFVLGFSAYTSLFFFSLFLQQAQGWSASATGWRMSPVFMAMAIMSSNFGWLAGRFGIPRLMLLGYALISLAMLAMSTFTPTTPYGTIAFLFALLGCGMGLAVPSTGTAVMMAAPRERTGAASSMMNALRQSGMTVGIALLGSLMSERAVTSLTRNLSSHAVADASAVAAHLMKGHAPAPELAVAHSVLRAMLSQAFADGFSVAAVVAGICGLVAGVTLILVDRNITRR